MKQAISGARIFTGDTFLDQHTLIISNGLIEAIVRDDLREPNIPLTILEGGVLAPGFIDTQVNGGGDVLFNNSPSPEALEQMISGHRRYGTTGMMPTLISDAQSVLNKGVIAVKEAIEQNVLGILGVHIEGPFFNLAKRGTHNASRIRSPSSSDIDWLCSLSPLKTVVTLAPEQTDAGQISALSDAGVLVCAGHTDASEKDIHKALKEGLRGFTHLYNAMRPLQSREPGVVGAALDDRDSWCGIICDGHHVSPTAIRIAHAAKAEGKLILVSDAMATVGGQSNSFTLYDEVIREENGRLINAEGNLAGSAIGMIDAVRVCVEQVGLPLANCLRMASRYPAEFLKLEHSHGHLKPGFQADLVHFHESTWRVESTWIQGQHLTH